MKREWPLVITFLIFGIVFTVFVFIPSEHIGLIYRIIFGFIALPCIAMSLLLANASGWGNPEAETSFKKNEIVKRIWFVKENRGYTVKVEFKDKSQTIVEMDFVPPEKFKVVGERDYVAYTDQSTNGNHGNP